jgi:hypothetical protein
MALDPALTERRVYGSRVGGIQRRWKLAVATGLLAFVGVVALFTLPELVAGRSVTSGGSHTTFFGGHKSTSSSTPTPTTETQTTTGTRTTTPTPGTTTPTTTTPAPTTTTPTTTSPAPVPTTSTPAPSAAPPATTTTTPAP